MQTNPNTTLSQAIRLAKAGKKASAARLLAQLLSEQPNNETAWLWLAACLSEPERQRYCLQRALQINPHNQRARQLLIKLSTPAGVAARAAEATPQSVPTTGGAQVFSAPAPQAGCTPARKARPANPTPAKTDNSLGRRVLLLIGITIIAAAILYFLWAFVLQKPSPVNLGPLALSGGPPFIVRVDPGPGLAEAVRTAPAGSTLQLGQGDYTLDQTLELSQPVNFNGAGVEKTHLILHGAGSGIHIQGIGPFNFKGLEIRYDGSSAADVIVVDSGVVNFSACRIAGALGDTLNSSGGIGLILRGATAGKVEHCEIVNNDQLGIETSGLTELVLNENLIHQNGAGIQVDQRGKPRLEGNILADNTGSGLLYFDKSGGKALQNEIRDNGGSGIEINGQANPLIVQNTIMRNQLFGIQVNNQASPMLLSNMAEQNSKAGIGYFASASGAAQDNECTGNEMHGISVNDQATPFIKENRCTGNKQVGIDYWGSAGGTAANNICSQNGLQGIAIHESAQPALQNNICKSNADSGITYWGSAGGSASNNECSDNQINGISLHNQAHPALTRNSCSGNTNSGIAYYNQSSGEASFNECAGNGKNDILKIDQASPRLESNQCTGQ